jgi:predicted RNase H-like HicB family nuclease
LAAAGPQRILYCYASGRQGAWEAICLDLDIAVQGQSFEEVSALLREAIALYLETVSELPEAERPAFWSRPVPFWTRLGFAAEAFWSALRAKADGELKHQFTMSAPITA